MGVLDGVHVPQGEGGVSGDFSPRWFQWHIFNRNVFNSYVKVREHFRTDNWKHFVYWLSKNIVSFKIKVGVCEKFAKT